jgi:RNA polymerase sigma-70 factor, ECF subfamily
MAFMVVLQRLTPAERAVLLLHEVFDFDHRQIASLLDKTEEASRQLLRRARRNMASTRRTMTASREEHLKLLRAFLDASNTGNVEALAGLLSEDAVLMTDGGPEGVRVGSVRNIPVPVHGRPKIAAVVASLTRRSPAGLERREWELNGQPAIVGVLDGRPVFAVLLAVADGKIQHIFIHADPTRLSHLGPLN